MAQMNIILGLSLLLAVGFALAYFARLAQLPSVTGYILAGILLGSSGFNLIDKELIESRLEVFTDIALLLVAVSCRRLGITSGAFGVSGALDLPSGIAATGASLRAYLSAQGLERSSRSPLTPVERVSVWLMELS